MKKIISSGVVTQSAEYIYGISDELYAQLLTMVGESYTDESINLHLESHVDYENPQDMMEGEYVQSQVLLVDEEGYTTVIFSSTEGAQ